MVIYTDGSADKNGDKNSPGGFAVVVYDDDGHLIDAYAERCTNTTNNAMEMSAIVYALEHYGANNADFLVPLVYSDSQYCVRTFNEWYPRWKANGWIKSDKKVPENLTLIKKFDKLSSTKRINLQWIKGHNKTEGNELADNLAAGRIKVENILNKGEEDG